MFTKISAFKRF